MKNSELSTLINDCLSDNYSTQLVAIEELQKSEAYEAVPVLLNLLKSDDEMIRLIVVEALGDLGKMDVKSVGAALSELLNDPDYMVRSSTIESLISLNYGPSISDAIYILKNDPEALVRISSIELLGELAVSENLEVLKALEDSLFNDENDLVRAYSAWAIGVLGTSELIPMLRARFETEEYYSPKVNLLAASYRLGDREALSILLSFFENINDDEAIPLLNILQELTYRKVPKTLSTDAKLICEFINQSIQSLSTERSHAKQVIETFRKFTSQIS